ncbi:MAG: DEAD/DEAH box helicase [Acidiferrobacterales bacterium]
MTTATKVRRPNTPSLGRLGALGPTLPFQVALLLPSAWEDLRTPVRDFGIEASGLDRPVLLQGKLASPPSVSFDRTPRLTGRIADAHGQTVGFTAFGDTRRLEEQLREVRDLLLYGTLIRIHGRLWLSNPQLVPPRWLGRLRPVYPGKPRVIAPERVRDRVLALLPEAIPEAAVWLRETLAPEAEGENLLARIAGVENVPLERLLWQAHCPRTIEEGLAAQTAVERLAAYGTWLRARARDTERPAAATWKSPAPWQARAGTLPFRLTDDQRTAIEEITSDLSGDPPMRRLLNGDVGTGKTAIFGLAAVSCLDGGGRVAILLPNERLAEQVHRNLSAWWPDVAPLLVTGSTRPDLALQSTRLLIGTTALLHRPVGRFALVVIDEQQKFSRDQREALADAGTHVLEASATCIPRSQALARYGIIRVSRLTRCHVAKNIETRIWFREDQRALFTAVRETLDQGHQVIVVYPRKQLADEAGAPEDRKPGDERSAAESAFLLWQRAYPGKVVLAHGGLDGDDNRDAMNAMRSGAASILIATTVVEVGIDLPGVRRLTVVHPEFLGLTQLHQLRGRIARTGGDGSFDLYLPAPVKEHTIARLQALVETRDGFEIADRDMQLRGFGDLSLSSDRQWGADGTFLFGRPIRTDLLESFLAKGLNSSIAIYPNLR